jgi:cyclase
MLRKRVIPILLLENDRLVKTFQYKNPKYIGDPINAIRIFNDKEVDELILVDIAATKFNRGPNFKLIEKISSECFMPLCYGGGIKTIEQAKTLFSIGVEKISIQTEFLIRPEFLLELSNQFGSQSIVVSIDIKRNFFGTPFVYSPVLSKKINISLESYIKNIEKLGAGEILISNMNLEGRMSGLDKELLKIVSKNTNLPIIANTGVGNIEHIKNGFLYGADAIGVGTFFVLHGPHKAVLITYPNLNNINL